MEVWTWGAVDLQTFSVGFDFRGSRIPATWTTSPCRSVSLESNSCMADVTSCGEREPILVAIGDGWGYSTSAV